MYLSYCDESGNTGCSLTDPQQPIHLVLALLVHESAWKPIERQFTQLKNQSLAGMGLPPNTELHACDLYQGKNAFRQVARSHRMGLLRSILDIVANGDLGVVWAAIDKPRLASRYTCPAHPHDLAFMLVAERCQRFLEQRPTTEYGLFIADESPGCEAMLRGSLRAYQEQGAHFGFRAPMDRILDTVHFVCSSESAFIQIADCCAYFTRRAVAAQTLLTDPWYLAIANRVHCYRLFP